MSFPVRVTRTLLARPLRVFSLGTGGGLLGGALPRRCQDHEQVFALEQGRALNDRERLRVVRDPVEDPSPDVLVDHFAAPEHDRHLYLLSCFEELLQTLELGLEIVLRNFRPELHLLQLGDVLLAPLVFFLLDRLELVASVVDQATEWRGGVGAGCATSQRSSPFSLAMRRAASRESTPNWLFWSSISRTSELRI